VEPPEQPENDAQLLRRCQNGDEAALTLFMRRHQERVFRLACRMLNDASLADDATAAVFVKVWTKSRSWRGDASPGTWLYRLAVRTILDVQRSQRRWWRRFGALLSPRAFAPAARGAEEVDKADERAAAASRLRLALEELSPSDRALVHLYYDERNSVVEIAAIMGVSADALKMRLSRARRRVRDRVQEMSHDE
jgi:RNA polymerase sigma-70 factor (ECF subfamily)